MLSTYVFGAIVVALLLGYLFLALLKPEWLS